MRSKLSWREKLEKDQQPKLIEIPPKMARFGKGKMLIPTPMVDELVRRIPKGKLVTVSELRRKLAADFSADVTCPLTTGIFVRICGGSGRRGSGERTSPDRAVLASRQG